MFLTHNVMNVTWSEKALRDAFLWGKTPFTLPATPKISVCCLCAHFFTHVMRGTQTKLDGAFRVKLNRMSWNAVASVFPSLYIAPITDRAPIEDDIHQLFGKQKGWVASMQTDTDDCVVYQNSRLWPQYESAFLTKNLMTFAPVSSLLRPSMLSSRIDLNLDPSIKPVTLSNFSVSVKEKLVS